MTVEGLDEWQSRWAQAGGPLPMLLCLMVEDTDLLMIFVWELSIDYKSFSI